VEGAVAEKAQVRWIVFISAGFEIFGGIGQFYKQICQAGGENYNVFGFEDFFNMLEFFSSIGQVLDDLDSNDDIK
jgi:hypothetical protein